MKRLTKKEKILIIDKAIIKIEEKSVLGCCHAISRSFFEMGFKVDSNVYSLEFLKEIFPRFKKHYAVRYFKAYPQHNALYWWNLPDQKIRISFLKWVKKGISRTSESRGNKHYL
jgi:hypothetical protein